MTGSETYIPFYDIPTCQEIRVWVHEDARAPRMAEKQSAVKKVMYSKRSPAYTKNIDSHEHPTRKERTRKVEEMRMERGRTRHLLMECIRRNDQREL
ncbi:hypothetical protein Trydic_g19617 [Trypoxylus dichotomus]